jgi:hypothetical protein
MSQPQTSSWTLSAWTRALIYGLIAFSAYFFNRTHQLMTQQYLDLPKFVAGTERLPFQRRVLSMWLLRKLLSIPLPASITKGHGGLFANPYQIWIFAIDMVAFGALYFFCDRLYRAVSPRARYRFLWYPILLFTLVWSYTLHTEANMYYPYDMLSLAFFTAGLYFIYTRKFLPLLLVILVGTLNRETTMFLIPIFVLDALAPIESLKTIQWNRLPWLKFAILSLAWASVKITLGHFYINNDASEDFIRLAYNKPYFLHPNNWPQMISGCGFLLPIIWILRRHIPNPRIAAYTLVFPIWFLVMCVYGVITETRIYGELCPLVAIASVLLIEAYGRETTTPELL